MDVLGGGYLRAAQEGSPAPLFVFHPEGRETPKTPQKGEIAVEPGHGTVERRKLFSGMSPYLDPVSALRGAMRGLYGPF